ncbi:hypothetical protein, partial [Deinococcus wulumuqiensis]|uniref:hypothetical protein n=1 Tax=Deinococcus wulumuqiensis TaxID=980427 RepID=UPI00242E0ED4
GWDSLRLHAPHMVVSWAGKGERGAALSARYVKEKTRWSAGRMASAKADLLEAWPQVFSMTPGDAATSRPETWWVDFDVLSELHAAYLKRQKEQQAQKRGPGRPKKPVPKIDTGFSQGTEKPVPGINTGFSAFMVGGAENLFRKPEHPCSENRNTPVPKTGTLKEKLQSTSERKVVVEDPATTTPEPQAPEQGGSQSQDNNSNFLEAAPSEQQPPVGGSADADITDEELDLLFVSGTDSEAKPEVTASENVPAAPAAPDEAPAAAPFVPTPESNLEVGKLLAAKLGGKARLTAMLSEPGRDNIRQKASWLDLEPARVQAILADAQAKCQGEGVTFITAITRRLDMALGARDLTKAPVAPGTSTTPGTLGKAYEVAPSVVVAKLTGQPLNAEPQEAPRKFVPGAAWQDQGGRTVTIEALDGGRYRLSDGTLIVAHELMKRYTFAGAGA